MSEQIRYEETKYGFSYGAAEITRIHSDEKAGWIILSVKSPRQELQIYVTKTGKIRVWNHKTGDELTRDEFKTEPLKGEPIVGGRLYPPRRGKNGHCGNCEGNILLLPSLSRVVSLRSSTYARMMIIMGLLAIGLIVFDFIQSWRFMVYVFTGIR